MKGDIDIHEVEYSSHEHYQAQMDDIQDAILLGSAPKNFSFISITEKEEGFPKMDVLDLLKFVGGEIISGSYMCNTYNDSIVAKDIDIYFKDEDHIKRWCEANSLTVPPTSYKLCSYLTFENREINLIYGVPFVNVVDLISGFDIRACTVSYNVDDKTVYAARQAIQDCYSKRIVFQTTCRNVTVRRLVKYLYKGMTLDLYQMAIFNELIRLKPNRDQELTGSYLND